jgi:ABC-type glycerol-3-phosphate transport system substrate-binding protein
MKRKVSRRTALATGARLAGGAVTGAWLGGTVFLGRRGLSRASAAAGRGTVRFAGITGAAVQAISEDLIPAFERATGIHVEATYQAYDALTQKTMTEFVSGSPSFDVLMFETSWGGRFSPFLEDLQPIFSARRAGWALTAAKPWGFHTV